jgi:hypothetical protein
VAEGQINRSSGASYFLETPRSVVAMALMAATTIIVTVVVIVIIIVAIAVAPLLVDNAFFYASLFLLAA